VAIGVSGIAKASPAVAHLANQTLNDIRHAALAYTFVRKVCAHSCDLLAEELERADVDADAIVVEGIGYRRVLRAVQTYMTTAGPVVVERALFKDRSNDRSSTSMASARPTQLANIPAITKRGANLHSTLWLPAGTTTARPNTLACRIGCS
jgi:hypothetical protein